MRIAALDLGTNSFHLLVADVHPDGGFEPIATEKAMIRLGDVVSRHGRITDAATDVAVATVRRFRLLAEAAGATELARVRDERDPLGRERRRRRRPHRGRDRRRPSRSSAAGAKPS